MANCTNCSAPLPPNSLVCEYCGSRNDIDLRGINYFTTNWTESTRICPRCAVGLKTIDLKINGRFLIERCEQCFGLFFDPGELEALLEAMVTNVFEVNRGELDAVNATMRNSDYGITYIKCPVCAKLMNRVNFGARSGVVVDRCRDHGVWLDGGELRHLFEWMKAGGKLLDQQQRDTLAKEDARERERRGDIVPSATGRHQGEYTDFAGYGSTLRRDDPGLFDIVADALRFFLK